MGRSCHSSLHKQGKARWPCSPLSAYSGNLWHIPQHIRSAVAQAEFQSFAHCIDGLVKVCHGGHISSRRGVAFIHHKCLCGNIRHHKPTTPHLLIVMSIHCRSFLFQIPAYGILYPFKQCKVKLLVDVLYKLGSNSMKGGRAVSDVFVMNRSGIHSVVPG